MAFGNEPKDLGGIPISSGYSPGSTFVAVQTSTNTSTDGSGNVSAPVNLNLTQTNSLPVQMGNSDGVAPANLIEYALGLYSNGPLDSTGKPQSLSFDRIRSWQGKVIGGSNSNITSTLAGDTNLVFSVAPKTIMPGQAIQLSIGAGSGVETVYVSTSYTISSSATSIPLQTPVVTAGSTTAKWDVYGALGPGTAALLPTGLLPVVLTANDPNGGLPTPIQTASLDGRGSQTILETQAGLYNGSTIDRQRGNLDNISVVASAAYTTTQTQADQTNYNHRGIIAVLDMTTVGTGSVTLEIDGKDPVSGKYYAILTGAAVVTNSTNIYRVYPGLTAAANATVSDILPRTWRMKVTANNANSCTYSVGAMLVV